VIVDERTDSIRSQMERDEDARLHPAATRSASAGRVHADDDSPVRLAFQRDRDRVTHSKAFRRLMHKTQMFLSPDGDHFRTRLTHTLEVTQIARTIARALRLNEDLVEAIGLAHDLGHTPFGHAGERALAEVFPGFIHSQQSLRVVDRIERDGRGLNLTNQVRDGIIHHSKPEGAITGDVLGQPETPEAQVVKISDGIAYINHDLDDALRGGLIEQGEVPAEALAVLGDSHSERINTLVIDIVHTSAPALVNFEPGDQAIRMSDEVQRAANVLRDFLFASVYGPINQLPSTLKAQRVVKILYEDARQNPDTIPAEFARGLADEPAERVAADYVAGMTDRYALARFEDLYLPKFWSV
jgi:dGTPase